jgi:hypothetical protein
MKAKDIITEWTDPQDMVYGPRGRPGAEMGPGSYGGGGFTGGRGRAAIGPGTAEVIPVTRSTRGQTFKDLNPTDLKTTNNSILSKIKDLVSKPGTQVPPVKTRVEPTFIDNVKQISGSSKEVKPTTPNSATTTQTVSGKVQKPKVDIKPGETPKDAVNRAQAELKTKQNKPPSKEAQKYKQEQEKWKEWADKNKETKTEKSADKSSSTNNRVEPTSNKPADKTNKVSSKNQNREEPSFTSDKKVSLNPSKKKNKGNQNSDTSSLKASPVEKKALKVAALPVAAAIALGAKGYSDSVNGDDTKKNSDKPADKPVDKPADNDAAKPADSSADNSADKPADSSADSSADNSADKPADSDSSSNNSADKPSDSSADKPSDSSSKPADKNAAKPSDRNSSSNNSASNNDNAGRATRSRRVSSDNSNKSNKSTDGELADLMRLAGNNKSSSSTKDIDPLNTVKPIELAPDVEPINTDSVASKPSRPGEYDKSDRGLLGGEIKYRTDSDGRNWIANPQKQGAMANYNRGAPDEISYITSAQVGDAVDRAKSGVKNILGMNESVEANQALSTIKRLSRQ